MTIIEQQGKISARSRKALATDRKLRSAGCRIEHRRKGQPAVWSHPEHGKHIQDVMLDILAGGQPPS